MEDAMASLAEDVASGEHDSLLLSGDNKAELQAYGTAMQKLTTLQEKLQQHDTMKDTGATRDEKIAARNRANMYQEQIAKLQERTQQIMKNPELKAEAESRMETAVRLLGKMTKAELQQEVVSLRERVNQLKRSYAARADARCKMFLDCLLSPIPSHQDASYFKLTPDRPTQHLAVQPHAPPMNLYFLRIKPPLRVEKSPQPC